MIDFNILVPTLFCLRAFAVSQMQVHGSEFICKDLKNILDGDISSLSQFITKNTLDVLLGLRTGSISKRALDALPDVDKIDISRGIGVYLISFWKEEVLVSFYIGQSQDARGIHQRLNNHRSKARKDGGTSKGGILYSNTVGFCAPNVDVDARILVNFGFSNPGDHNPLICLAEALCIAFCGSYASGYNLGYWYRFLERVYADRCALNEWAAFGLPPLTAPSADSNYPMQAAIHASQSAVTGINRFASTRSVTPSSSIALSTSSSLVTSVFSPSMAALRSSPTLSYHQGFLLPLPRPTRAQGLNKELGIENHGFFASRDRLRQLCSDSERQSRVARVSNSEYYEILPHSQLFGIYNIMKDFLKWQRAMGPEYMARLRRKVADDVIVKNIFRLLDGHQRTVRKNSGHGGNGRKIFFLNGYITLLKKDVPPLVKVDDEVILIARPDPEGKCHLYVEIADKLSGVVEVFPERLEICKEKWEHIKKVLEAYWASAFGFEDEIDDQDDLDEGFDFLGHGNKRSRASDDAKCCIRGSCIEPIIIEDDDDSTVVIEIGSRGAPIDIDNDDEVFFTCTSFASPLPAPTIVPSTYTPSFDGKKRKKVGMKNSRRG